MRSRVRSIRQTLLGAFALLGLVACSREGTVQENKSQSVNDQVNALSEEIGEHDGASGTSPPLDADGVGRSMRAGAAQRPRQPL